MERSPGQTICERFELVREEPAGTGTPVFGPRWAAVDLDSGELVRLVFIGPELLGGARASDVLVSSRLAALSELRDDALVPVCFAGVEGDALVLAYEGLYGGIAVAEVFGDLAAEERAAEHVRYAVELARGVRALHCRGLVQAIHGIELVFDWERGYALWCYGIAEVCAPEALRAACAAHAVTLAPEQVERGGWTKAADLYGWAASVAAFLAGADAVDPVGAARAGELSGLDERLVPLLQRCLEESPERRFMGGDELVLALVERGLCVESDQAEAPLQGSSEASEASQSPPIDAPAAPAEPAAEVAPPAPPQPSAPPPSTDPDLVERPVSILDGILGLDLPPPPDLMDLPPLLPLPGEAEATRSALSASIDAAIAPVGAPVGAAVDAALGLASPPPARTPAADPEKRRPEPRPAPAVIVKAPPKPSAAAPPAGKTDRVRVLGSPVVRADVSATEAPSTASLVSAALAAGRVTPASLASTAGGAGAPEVSAPAGSSTATDPDAARARSPASSARSSAKVAAADGGREPDAPVLRRDRRTHPLGWAVQSEPVAVATGASAEAAKAPPAAERSSSGLVDTQAIVEATSIPVQPGVSEASKGSSMAPLILLAVAAGLLVLAVLMYGS